MSEADNFYLPRRDQDALVELLDQIPSLVEDLAISVTRQDRIGHNGPRVRNGNDEQPLPVNLNAAEAADLLHDTLAAWVKHTTEHRAMTYTGRDDTLTLARWLKRWIVALALSPGADEALGEIRHAIHNARRTCDRPRDKPTHTHDVELLNQVPLTKAELRIAIKARTGAELPRQTLNSWISRGNLTEVDEGRYSVTDAIQLIQKHAKPA